MRRVIADTPRFRLRWLATGRTGWPAWFDDPEWIPRGERAVYTRVKSGLRAVLETLDRDGVAMLPSYTPGGIVWAALAAGFDVRYYPVGPDLTLPRRSIEARIDRVDPDVVVFIQYFGFVDESYPALRKAAKATGALVVEDCARGLFSRENDGTALGSTGDVSLFCLHKTLPAPNGGLVVRTDGPLPEPTGSCSERDALLRVAGGSLLQAAGVREPRTVVPIDQQKRQRPNSVALPSRLLEPGGLSRRAFRRCDPETVQSARLKRYVDLRSRLVDSGADVVTPRARPGASPYGVGVLAPSEADRETLYAELQRRGLPAEVLTWPPVYRHEALDDLCGASTLRRRLIVLPTHQQMPLSAIPRMADCVLEGLDRSEPATPEPYVSGPGGR